MTYVQKARLTFLGIDDELKNDATSVYTTNINSSFFPIPANAVFAVAAPKDLFFSKKRPIFSIKMQEFSISLQYARGHPATFRGDFQPSAGSRAVISSREQSRRAECASHGARLQRPGPQNGPAL